MNNYLEIVGAISDYVEKLYSQYPANDLMYHNLKHTETVVEKTDEIAATYSFSPAESFILSAAAWFHDTGHLIGGQKLHEDRSVQIMKKFLGNKGVPADMIDAIESCICATKFPPKPKSLLEEIICDADTYNLGTEDFLRTDELLKQEFELRDIAIDNWEEIHWSCF